MNTADGTKSGVQPNAFGCITVPFLLIALIPLSLGARTQWANGELARSGDVVPGRVIELRYVPTNPSVSLEGGGSGSSPVVTFTTRAGEERTMVGSVNRRPAPWAVGDTVDVVYDRSDPARADVLTEISGWRLWFGIWCAVALLPVAIALLPVVVLIRERRSRHNA